MALTALPAAAVAAAQDLRGRAVASHGIYVQELQDSFGLAVINQSFNSGADQLKLGQEVSAGVLTAGVGSRGASCDGPLERLTDRVFPLPFSCPFDPAIDDLPAMQYVANTAVPLCDLRVLDEVLLPFDYAIAFRKGAGEARVDAFSGAVLRLQESQALEGLRETYIVGATAYGGCSADQEVGLPLRVAASCAGCGMRWTLHCKRSACVASLRLSNSALTHPASRQRPRAGGGGGVCERLGFMGDSRRRRGCWRSGDDGAAHAPPAAQAGREAGQPWGRSRAHGF